MEDLVQQRGLVKLTIKNEPFSQKYQVTLVFGWTEAMTWKKPRETPVFEFKTGQIVQVQKIRKESFKTKPPNRWGDSTLIRRLEILKIGTKSSRPEIIKKLELRKYIQRKGTAYESTQTGQNIIRIFDEIWPDLVTPKFTRHVELRMDEVATQKCSYEIMIETIRKEYALLHKKLLARIPDLQTLLKEAFLDQNQKTAVKKGKKRKANSKRGTSYNCPLCKEGNLIQRTNSRTKEKFYGCSRFPICKFTNPRIKYKNGTFGPTMYRKQ
jgi:DNA topoisomerase-1